MWSEEIEYWHDDVALKGVFTHPKQGDCPGVLLVPDWSGRKPEYLEAANFLAECGYASFIVDMFGNGLREFCKEKKLRLILPFLEHRDLLQARMQIALQSFCENKGVIQSKIGVIGYCFGGMCALDLARMGADIKACISVHGLLTPANNIHHPNINAAVLALHGNDDRMVTERDIRVFAEEMTKARADWQLQIFGHAMHAFSAPEANDPSFGALYDPKAAQRAWMSIQRFLSESFM